MASLLNKTPHELALELKDMDKEKRYQNLKEFYIKEYPETNEFYDHFENKKKNCEFQNDQSSPVSSQKQCLEIKNTSLIQNKNTVASNDYLSELFEENIQENTTSNNNITELDFEKNKNTRDYDKLLDDLFN